LGQIASNFTDNSQMCIIMALEKSINHLISRLCRAMQKTTLTLSESVSKTLKVYTVQSKSSLRAQSLVIEEALKEFFERHNVKIEE
jgi:hypothetical protein